MAKEFDMGKYAKMFITESQECLRQMNDAMLALEKEPKNRELVDQIFRCAHTIKGMAGMMSYTDCADTAHAIEDVLSCIREGKLSPSGSVSELIFKGLDAIERVVASLEKKEPLPDNKDLVLQLRAVVETAASAERETEKEEPPPEPAPPEKPKKAHPAPKGGKNTVTVVIKFSRKCSLPSARAVVIIKDLSKVTEILETVPNSDEIEHEHVFEEFTLITDPAEKLPEAVRRVLAMTDVEQIVFGPSNEPREKWARLAKEVAQTSVAVELAPAQTVKVGMDKLDDLLDNVGELVIGRSRLLEMSATGENLELHEVSSIIDKLTSDIQSRVLGIRMIPLDLVLSRFPRMVRDISKNEGKDVELVIESGNIELDRTVVDKISEPLMHILRNCVDHGIESVEDRKAAGKLPKGLIRVVASKQQDHVLIEVTDDGRGIDLEEIRRAAVRKGAASEQQAAAMSGRDLIDLLFKPGFSTKTEVTQVSGRGVGLDIVRKNVEELGGTVMVNTTKGAGTTFSLWLPFTLAIIDAMLVGIHNQTYAVPMGTIVESHRYEPTEVKLIRNREVVQLRGEVLPLIRMREFFGLEGQEKTPEGTIYTLVVQSRERRAAIEVDELIGHQQIVVKALDRRLRGVRGVSGGTILGSGKIALILDVESVIGG